MWHRTQRDVSMCSEIFLPCVQFPPFLSEQYPVGAVSGCELRCTHSLPCTLSHVRVCPSAATCLRSVHRFACPGHLACGSCVALAVCFWLPSSFQVCVCCTCHAWVVGQRTCCMQLMGIHWLIRCLFLLGCLEQHPHTDICVDFNTQVSRTSITGRRAV